MLEYCKIILSKVSFDKILFEKELGKAIQNLKSDDLNVFRQWCYEQFGDLYLTILNQNFDTIIGSL